MRIILVLSIAMACLLMQACGPKFVTHDQLSALRMGDNRSTVEKALDMQASGTQSLTVDGTEYTVENFPLMMGSYTTGGGWSGGGFGGGGLSSAPMMNPTSTTIITTRILILYKDNKVRYWGMMGDFSKSEDPEIADLAPKIYTVNDQR